MNRIQGCLLRVFIGESDKHDGMALYEWIVKRAKEAGLTGATVIRGIEGFGGHSQIHTARILQLSMDLPIVIEIIDTREKIDAFLPTVEQVVTGGIATLENVEMLFLS
jgi:hypothetical protein